MCKASFAVGYQMNGKTQVVLGVTSIFPNLNGVLLCTENGHHIQIERDDMRNGLNNMFIDYDQDFEGMNYTIQDCRIK